jgi:hypothetical protein
VKLFEEGDRRGGEGDAVVNNKLAFALLFGAFADRLPALYGVLRDGHVYRDYPTVAAPPGAPGDETPTTDATEAATTDATEALAAANEAEPTRTAAGPWVASVLDAAGRLVLKPVYGFGGDGVHVCRSAGDGVVVDGERESRAAFVDRIDALDDSLVTAYVDQADHAARLFPDATNTLRVVTLRDPDTGDPFVADAVHRIGTRRSAPVDNWSRGGLSATIRDDGTLSPGAQWLPDRGVVRWFESHPDTGERIVGTPVPDWEPIREGVLSMARAMPYLPRVGWDVLPTGDGEFVVLEANAHAATRTLQVHGPLLRDDRVRRFYEAHGCL